MQLSARSAAIPKGRPVCLWLGNDSEWCAGALRFVYCTECTWHSVHLSSVHLYICCCDCCAFVVVIGLCADLGMQLSSRSAVLPLGKAVELYWAGCSWHSAFAVVSRFCVGFTMRLGLWGDVLPAGREGLGCGLGIRF